MTSVYWNLARFWFSVPYAINLEKKMMKMILKNVKKKKSHLPTLISLNIYP